MQQPDSLTQQAQITKVMWGALLFSNCIFTYLVWSGTIADQKNVSDIWHYSAFLAVVVALGIFFYYTKSHSDQVLNDEYQKIMYGPLPKMNVPAAQMRQFELLNEQDQKRFYFNTKVLSKSILLWSLCESISVLGIVSIFLGMPETYYYYFFAIAVALMLHMRPTHLEIL